MIKIRCVIEGITYQNQENGYSVLKGKAGKEEQPLSTVPPKPCEYMESESYSMAADPGREYAKKQK